jgi:hypothetical protein
MTIESCSKVACSTPSHGEGVPGRDHSMVDVMFAPLSVRSPERLGWNLAMEFDTHQANEQIAFAPARQVPWSPCCASWWFGGRLVDAFRMLVYSMHEAVYSQPPSSGIPRDVHNCMRELCAAIEAGDA